MSQMLFSHDTELTLRAACALVNSDRVDGEQLGRSAALDNYLDAIGWTGRRDHDDAEVAAVHSCGGGWAGSGRPPTTRRVPSGRSTRCCPTPARRRG